MPYPKDELIVRALQGYLDEEEERALLAWRAASAENEREFRQNAALWALLEAGAPAMHESGAPDVEGLLAKAGGLAAAAVPASRWQPIPPTQRKSAWRRRLGAARVPAAVAVVLLVGFALFSTLFPPTGEIVAIGEIATGSGEMVTVTLEDGTAIRVAPESTLQLSQVGKDQIAWLEGQAFFGVQRDPSRTFTVRTANGEATALGTRFQVRAEEGRFEVLVVEGSVRVSAAGTPVEIGEGLRTESINGSPPATSRVTSFEPHLGWMGRALAFQRTPLPRAVEEIEQRYGVEVVVADDSLAELTVTATFTDKPVEQVLPVLCAAVGAQCIYEDNSYHIQRSDYNGP